MIATSVVKNKALIIRSIQALGYERDGLQVTELLWFFFLIDSFQIQREEKSVRDQFYDGK